MAERQVDLFGAPVPVSVSVSVSVSVGDALARERARVVLSRQLPCRARCDCQDIIVWAWTEAGERMPVDAAPAEHGGSLVLTVDSGGQVHARVVDRSSASARAAAAAGIELHRPHWASCPYAEVHQRRAARARSRGRGTQRGHRR
ncbi:MAG: hypothetical protein ACRDTG_29265 [Pseudonocardiaceae bacterium]